MDWLDTSARLVRGRDDGAYGIHTDAGVMRTVPPVRSLGFINETLPPASLGSIFFAALPVVLRGAATGSR